jgi:hypothetical protein
LPTRQIEFKPKLTSTNRNSKVSKNCGDIQKLYADVKAMDLGHCPVDGKTLVKKVARTLRASKDFRVWSDQPLFNKNVSALVHTL